MLYKSIMSSSTWFDSAPPRYYLVRAIIELFFSPVLFRFFLYIFVKSNKYEN